MLTLDGIFRLFHNTQHEKKSTCPYAVLKVLFIRLVPLNLLGFVKKGTNDQHVTMPVHVLYLQVCLCHNQFAPHTSQLVGTVHILGNIYVVTDTCKYGCISTQSFIVIHCTGSSQCLLLNRVAMNNVCIQF